jgi:rhamnulokinase
MMAKIAAYARATAQPPPRSPGELVRCCLESLALSYRHTLDALETLLGRRFEVLHVVGGGGRNALLNQMTADAIGRPVIVGPHEATALGNALTQAIGAGQVRDLAHLRAIVRASCQPVTFAPRARTGLEAQLPRFRQLLAASPIQD